MHSNCIKKLLNLEEVVLKNIKHSKDFVEVFIELPKSEQTCPNCGAKTSNVHDYYTQPIKNVPIQFKPTKLIYRKRRYVYAIVVIRNFTKRIISFLNTTVQLLD